MKSRRAVGLLALSVAACTAALVLPRAARLADADPSGTVPPSTAPAPLLDEISHETQNLFQTIRPGLVRVELPPPKLIGPLSAADDPVQKWGGRLNADVLQKLVDAQMRAAQGRAGNVQAFLSTQPATSQPVNPQSINAPPADRMPRAFVIARPDGGFEFVTGGAPPYDAAATSAAGPRFLGIVLDDAGHVLIPVFVQKDALDGRPIHVLDAQGKFTLAGFVGSDRQTNLTVLQMESPVGRPVTLAGDRPADGSLVMLLSPDGGSGQLSIWTGGQQERGLLIATNGDVGGFVRFGQFLSGDAMRPIAADLIRYGRVRRATLGVLIYQSQTPDGRPAMCIEQVIDHSAAADAGLREGDFILTLAGSPVCDVPSFAAAIAQRDGQTELQILRDGQASTVTVNLKPQ